MQIFFLYAFGILLFLILLSGWGVLFLLYQIIGQQGRLLIRLDEIEGLLQGSHSANKQPALSGLPVGEIFPAFRLPRLDGREVALEEFLGKRVLLVNWSPHCGFCVKAAAELAKFKHSFAAHNVTLLLASSGDADGNRKMAREHGLEDFVLLRPDSSAIAPFQSFGTPVAYLLDEKGRVAMPIAIGADKATLLARYAVGEAVEAELNASPLAKKATCGQNPAKPAKPEEIEGTGPGTELKKLLAAFGIRVTPDCPCNERAAVMNRNGWEWCEQNIGTIVEWMREESARRGIIFVGAGARFLVNRAISRARRNERQATPDAVGLHAEERTS